MHIVLAALLGFLLDLMLGDPAWMPHPVVFMGKAISALEKLLRRIFPKTSRGKLAAGVVLAVALPAGTLAVTLLALWLCSLVHPALSFALEVIWCWQALAMRGLRDESRNVYNALTGDTLENARLAVARVVGRDTQALSAEGVTKAAVETVAENSSDGIIAPMLYMAIGGIPLMFLYKGINTMDSMLGYKNDKYLYFGRCAAKLDDVANYIPARTSGWLMALSTVFVGMDTKNAVKIYRRDRRNHASPNSAQTEAAMAGALDVQLAGNAYYFGKLYEKPTIGDPIRPVEIEDISRSNRLLYATCIAGAILFWGVRMLVWLYAGI